MSKTDATITRKDMKEPDKFQQAATQAASWIAARRRHVVLAGAIVVGAVLLLAILQATNTAREERAGAAAADLLATMAGEISSVPLPGVQGPFFPTDEARQRAVVDGAEKVLAAHGGTGAAQLAALALGDAHAFADRADLERARVLARAGKAADAKELLATFGARHKESLLTAEASERLARLGGN